MSSYGFFSDNPVIRNSILQIGDTTEVYDVFGAKSVMITVVDSSNSLVDSLYAFVQGGDTTSTVNFYWAPVAVHDVGNATLTTNTVLIKPGDGTNGSYIIAQPDGSPIPFTRLRIVRSNKSTNDLYAPRTKISVIYSK